VRFVCERIGLECDESRLEARISEFRYAKSVRVNKKAKSVIIGFESNFDEIKEFIENLPIENFNKRKVSPNKSKIYKAATALAVTPFINNNGVKAMASLIAAAPLLKEGASEALKGGITSKVLEATAVGVSLARRDFLAANSTNLMLTIGEYMEESAVHRSDDLIKELARPNIEEVWIEVNNHGKKSLKKIFEERPEMKTVAEHEATNFIRNYILLEDKMLDWIFEQGELEFFSKKDLANYMRYRLDDSLTQLGLDKPFNISGDEAKPMMWFEEEVFSNELDDFFAKRPTAYTKHDKSITENDLF